jgi:hypothetical protein
MLGSRSGKGQPEAGEEVERRAKGDYEVGHHWRMGSWRGSCNCASCAAGGRGVSHTGGLTDCCRASQESTRGGCSRMSRGSGRRRGRSEEGA